MRQVRSFINIINLRIFGRFRKQGLIMKKLSDYGYSSETVKAVKPVIEKVNLKNNLEFAKAFGSFTFMICEQVEKRKLSPRQADDCFTLIDLYISDNHSDFVLGEKIEKILFEGMILHDLGKEYGSKIETIKELASNLWGKQK